LPERGLVIGVDPENGAGGVAAATVGIFERDLGFPLLVMLVSLRGIDQGGGRALPGPAQAPESGALVVGGRRKQPLELGKDVAAVNDILIAGERD
jgi:hypothetical protein